MTRHVPILIKPIVESLVAGARAVSDAVSGCWIVDCTLGGGGHTSALLEALQVAQSSGNALGVGVWAFDQDPLAVEAAQLRFASEIAQGRLRVTRSRMSELPEVLCNEKVGGLLADLGFSSDQMDDPGRGLSFQSDGPLDMRMDPTREESCEQFLQRVSEGELVQVISEYGEERFARRIGASLIRARQSRQLPRTPRELSLLIVQALPAEARKGRIHAATRTFQALRIQVNQEMAELQILLGPVISLIQKGGRAAIMSFHSLEDRAVKQALFRSRELFRPLTKKPLVADDLEIQNNPRSRSAKLRIAERI